MSKRKETKHTRYESKQNENGLVRVHPFVPERDREKLFKYAARLRAAYKKECANEDR